MQNQKEVIGDGKEDKNYNIIHTDGQEWGWEWK